MKTKPSRTNLKVFALVSPDRKEWIPFTSSDPRAVAARGVFDPRAKGFDLVYLHIRELKFPIRAVRKLLKRK